MHDGIDPADKPDVSVRTWSRADWAIVLSFLVLLVIATLATGNQPIDLSQLR